MFRGIIIIFGLRTRESNNDEQFDCPFLISSVFRAGVKLLKFFEKRCKDLGLNYDENIIRKVKKPRHNEDFNNSETNGNDDDDDDGDDVDDDDDDENDNEEEDDGDNNDEDEDENENEDDDNNEEESDEEFELKS